MTPDKITETRDALLANAEPLERGILATVLDNLSLIKLIRELIEPADFSNDSGRKLYTWMLTEFKAGHTTDSAVALSTFAGDPKVEPYLLDVLSGLPSPGALKRQAEELRSLSVRRATLMRLHKAIASVSQTDAPIGVELSKLSHDINSSNQRLNANQDSTLSFSAVGDIWKEKFQRRVAGDVTYQPTGYDELDALILGLEPQDLIILGARPSMGKTTVAMNIVENIAFSGKPVMVFSMEMPADAIYQRSLSSVAGVDHEDLRAGRLKVGDKEKIELARKKLADAPIYIDDTPALSQDQLSARAHRQNEKTPLGLIMVDYLQLMQVAKHHLGNANAGIGEISRGLKQLARDIKCPVIALSQLSRNLEQRPNKRPINSDLRDSGSIEQDADVIMFVYRDEVYNADSPQKGIAEIIIGKQRNGPLGTAYLSFAKGQSRFSNMSHEQKARLESILKNDTGNGAQKGKPSGRGGSKRMQGEAPTRVEDEGGTFAKVYDENSLPFDLPPRNQEHLADVRDQLA